VEDDGGDEADGGGWEGASEVEAVFVVDMERVREAVNDEDDVRETLLEREWVLLGVLESARRLKCSSPLS
jgi:hypothetical protein